MSRPVLVQVVQELTPGGIQVMVLELERWLGAEFEVHVVSLEGTVDGLRSAWPRTASLGDRLHALAKAPGVHPATTLRLTRLLARLRPLAVHTHHIGPLLHGGLAARVACVRRLVHTEHDAWHLDSANHRRLQRAALALFRPRLVADAPAVAAALQRAIPSSRPRLIANGIDVERFTPGEPAVARRTFGLPQALRLVGTAGRLEHVKAQDLLIEAFAALPSDVGLAIAGDGSRRDELERLAAALGVRGRVHFLGHIEDMPAFYRSLDVFCLPSRAEGLPLALLEAQACGVPAVATDVGGVGEVLAPGISLGVPAGDVARLAAAIATVLARVTASDPRPFVLDGYGAPAMAAAYRRLLIS